MEIESFIRFVVLVFAVGLFVVAAYLYLSKSTGPASSAMAFVFLLVLVLTISNYKRIKGFGFEAEMWEEKQVQAANLIDRLELLSRGFTQQVAQLASKLGLMSSGFSNPELANLVDLSRKILQTTGTSDPQRQNILAPLYERIALNYVWAAQKVVDVALQKEREKVEASRKLATGEDANALQQQLQSIDAEFGQVRKLDSRDMASRKSIQPLQNFVSNAPQLSARAEVSSELSEIAADMSYFEANGSLRREIDWSYLWR